MLNMCFRDWELTSGFSVHAVIRRHLPTRNWFAIFSILLCVIAPGGASADSMSENFSNLYQGISDFGEKIFPGRKTMITIGLGPKYSPDYLGSDDYDFEPDVAFFVKLKRFEASNSGLSFDFLKQKNIALGTLVKFTGGRKEKANEVLTGLGNINKSIHLGLYAQYVLKTYSFRLAMLKDLTSWNQGWHGFFRISNLIYNNGPWAVIGAFRATWGDDDYTSTWFGIDDEQSDNSGIPVYDVGSGIRDVSLELSSRYALGAHWSIDASIRYRRLLSGAANSPLVADFGSADQITVAIYGAYTF